MNSLEKQIVKIMAGAQLRTSCLSLFQQLQFLPVACPYTLSRMNFFVNGHENV